MKTRFALQPLQTHGHTFWFDGNGKITLDNGTFEHPVANAFSLVQVADCPGATQVCAENCYVHRLEDAEPDIHVKYRHNSHEIRRMLDGHPHLIDEVAWSFSYWIKLHSSKGFRWHVSGDVFSTRYAYFIGIVCRRAPEVRFWLYTRSFKFLPALLSDSASLVVNLSADADNYAAAMEAHKQYGLRICYMTVDGTLPDNLPDGSVIFPSHQLRGRDLPKPTDAPWWQGLTLRQRKIVCPPDFFGQSEKLRCGPCKKCLF